MRSTRSRRARYAGLALSAVLASTATVTLTAPSALADPPGISPGKPGRTDPTTLTVSETLRALKTHKVTAVELLEAYLERIDEFDRNYNAFTQMNPDAMADALASDQRRHGPKSDVGALDGVPIVIKDSLDVEGMPTTSGWELTSPVTDGVELVPERDAAVVDRLRAEGAVIVGKTNLPVLAGSGSNANNSAYGPTYNALNQRWAPGGSSTGSATSVAADFAATGIAEETGGSIQNPASAQSLYAVKPTFGLIPNTGNFPLAGNTRDVLGPLVKSPEDAALMLDVLAGEHPDDPKTGGAVVPEGGYTSELSPKALKGKRIGLYGPGWRSGEEGELSPETEKRYTDAVAKLEARGATVVEDPFAGSGFADIAEIGDGGYDNRGSVGNAHAIEEYLQGLGEGSPVGSVEELDAWADENGFAGEERIDEMVEELASDPEVDEEFLRASARYQKVFDEVMSKHELDALVLPQQLEEIPGIYDGEINASTVSEINIAGLPGVVVPDGAYESGKPFNLIFVDRKWSEAELLGYAYDYAKAYGGRIVNRDLSHTPGPEAPSEN